MMSRVPDVPTGCPRAIAPPLTLIRSGSISPRALRRPNSSRAKVSDAAGVVLATPEIAGLSSRELINIIRGLQGLNLVGADIVEVAPAYDHAEITSLAAATLAFEMVNLVATRA